MHFILTYQTVKNFNDRKQRFRSKHLELVKSYYQQRKLIMGGALLEPNDAALLIFKCDGLAEVEAFVEKDIYYQKGLILEYSIRQWSVAIGDEEE